MISSFKSKEKKPKGKPGAQFGHEGHEQKLYPVEQCLQVEDYYPQQCIECGAALQGSDTEPYRVQQVDIPPVVPIVHEHRFHALTCGCCGAAMRAWDEALLNGMSVWGASCCPCRRVKWAVSTIASDGAGTLAGVVRD